MRYSEIFNVSDADLDSKGVFNADVDSDSQLHIDPSLFKYSQIPEFNGAYDEFNNYFARVFTGIVPYAKNDARFFNQLIRHLSFREIGNTCLGYSKSGTHGSGIGGTLAKQVAQTVIKLYDIGISNPVAFEMLPFFEEGIGADRISDMSAYLLIRRLINYTQRVCTELGIPMEPRVKLYGRSTDVPTYKHHGYVFVPSEVLCDLPTASSHDDIDSVCHYNDMFRQRICQAIGAEWSKFKNAPKSRIKQYLFDNPGVFKDFINEYENTKHQPYNFVRDKKHVMDRCYITSLRGKSNNKYVRIEFNNEDQAKTACDILQHSELIKGIYVLETDDEALKGRILEVYPQPSIAITKVEQEINSTLLNFFLTRRIVPEETVAVPEFENIQKIIIEELNKAINTIYVCVAWFTDNDLRDVLLARHQAGVDVRVITYLDGVNKKYGVDFKEIPHIERRGERCGLMHRKYCIIDNHITISGSYNWTDNASERNDENIEIIQDWSNANTSTRQFLDDWNNK